MPKVQQRPDAEEQFRRDIDDYNFWDLIYKQAERERKKYSKRIIARVKKRGRGTYNGNESSIFAHDVVRNILSQEKVQAILSTMMFNACFRPIKWIQLAGGPLKPSDEVVPELGPPEVLK